MTPTEAFVGATLHWMWRHRMRTSATALTGMVCGALALLASALALANTAYRCGDAYGPSAQCTHGPATPIQPTAELRTTGPDKSDTAAHELREAQALEKQRRLAERHAVQTTPVRVNTFNASPAGVTNNEPLAQHGMRKSKHSRKTPSPYFTAVDPNAKPKKKSTAKAVPATSASSQ